MLDAMERETINFPIKVRSTENVEKNVEERRRKNQTYLFSKLLVWTTSSKVTFSQNFYIFIIFKYYIFKILT